MLRVFDIWQYGIRKIPTRKIPTHQTPPGKIPPQKIATWNIPAHDFKYSHPRFLFFVFS